MEKRIFVAVAVSIAFLWIWAAVAPRLFPDLVKKAPVATTSRTAETPAHEAGTAPAVTTSNAAAARPSVAAAPVAVVPVSAVALQTTRVDTRDFVAVFSNRGGELVSFQLKHYQDAHRNPVELVKGREANRVDFPFAIEAKDPALTALLNGSFYQLTERAEKGARVLEYHFSDGRVSATKTFRIGDEYLFDFSVAVSPATPYRISIGPGLRTLAPDERDSQFVITGNGVVEVGGKLTVVRREKAEKLAVYEVPQFVGIEDNYFLTVLRPTKGEEAALRRIEVKNGKEVRKELYASVNASSDGVVAGQSFFGPKQTRILEKYGLESTLQFGWFGFIARLLLEVLVRINAVTKNYGFAIIVLTILIKVVLYPLQHKSIVSMKKMQRVQPKVEGIKNKYKKARSDPEQRQKMNVDMMKLYQQEGINPMGGCLPMVLQLPILWGFYGLLSRAIELRGATFIWWIHDLAAKDPYYITPLLMTVTMFIQQALTPTTADPAQKKMFLVMPLIFGWIFKEFPSGLVLYWLVQNILTIVQQMIMNKYWKDHPAQLQTTT